MTILLAGMTAAGISWVLNVHLVNKNGESAIIWLIPFGEEIIKTGVSVLLNASVPAVHVVFGFIEALHDFIVSPVWRTQAAILSILIHWAFGQITLKLFHYTNVWVVSVIFTGMLHVLWNFLIIKIFAKFVKAPKRN